MAKIGAGIGANLTRAEVDNDSGSRVPLTTSVSPSECVCYRSVDEYLGGKVLLYQVSIEDKLVLRDMVTMI